MGEYGCQWNKPLFSKKLQEIDFVSKQAVKGLKLKKLPTNRVEAQQFSSVWSHNR